MNLDPNASLRPSGICRATLFGIATPCSRIQSLGHKLFDPVRAIASVFKSKHFVGQVNSSLPVILELGVPSASFFWKVIQSQQESNSKNHEICGSRFQSPDLHPAITGISFQVERVGRYAFLTTRERYGGILVTTKN